MTKGHIKVQVTTKEVKKMRGDEQVYSAVHALLIFLKSEIRSGTFLLCSSAASPASWKPSF
jgi:hypothetical protein